MSAKNMRIVGISFGVVMLLLGFMAKRNWLKALLLIIGAVNVVGNVLADNKVFENVEAQINAQINEHTKKEIQ